MAGGSWSAHVASWAGRRERTRLVLRYEDMQAIPERCFGTAIRFLGGDPVPERLAKAIGFSGFAGLRAQEQAAGFIERPATAARFFRSGRAGQWREALSREQAAAIERDHGTVMARFGYS